MTTAHRPTWKAAVGQASNGGWTAGGATSSGKAVLSLPSHTQLKVRQGSQIVDRQRALKESLLKLEEAEKKAPSVSKRRPISQALEEEGRLKLLKHQSEEVDDVAISKKYNDDDDADDDDEKSGGGWSDVDNHADNGDSGDDLDASSDEDDDNDSSDDEDDEAALQAELAKIRAEREAVKQKEAEEEAKQEESKLEQAALLGNPLLAGDGGEDLSGKFKRKWNDDVVFRNQAKGEPEVKKRFINDTIRNDFHKRFLNKFIH
jgi:protein CWC15